ncbi:HAD family hydrolase, partial [Lactobacillus reuteri]|nr:HAD family hydrolase [Limosilactobacillus reuteri]
DKYWAVKEAVTPLRNRIKNSKFFPSQDSTK